MIEKIRDAVLKKVRETFIAGDAIAVVGWLDRNHSRFTRQLSDDWCVFVNPSRDRIPKRVKYTLFTRFVHHAEFGRLRENGLHHPVPLEIGQIKRILESCKDLLVHVPHSVVCQVAEDVTTVQVAEATTVVQSEDDLNDALDFLTKPKEHHEMSDMDRFTRAFIDAAASQPDHTVGKRVLKKIRDATGVREDAPALVAAGWIVGGVRPGKKHIGYYTAGQKMGGSVAHVSGLEPDDPIERAKFYIAQEDRLNTEKADLEAKIKEVNQKIARVAALRQLLDQMEKLVK